ncbi:MAG TPA: 30S ribosomal protein S3 [Alphaproteobacteria bacterium]|nr:30S ribosomal protein S3 [Alphaproteobacteria bacterium]
MGQKVNPIGFRVGINKTWDSRWFANKADYQKKFHEDVKIRTYLEKKLKDASVSKKIIERSANKIRITLYTSKPGIIIGKKGADIEDMKKFIAKFTKDEVSVNIVEIRKPEVDANIIAQGIAQQLERRVSYKRAMKRSMQSCMKMGAEGIRVNISGRLNGSEIARMEWYREGRVPLHTLRADVDFATAEALTTYGKLGVKVWVYKGEILAHDPYAHEKKIAGVR